MWLLHEDAVDVAKGGSYMETIFGMGIGARDGVGVEDLLECIGSIGLEGESLVVEFTYDRGCRIRTICVS